MGLFFDFGVSTYMISHTQFARNRDTILCIFLMTIDGAVEQTLIYSRKDWESLEIKINIKKTAGENNPQKAQVINWDKPLKNKTYAY